MSQRVIITFQPNQQLNCSWKYPLWQSSAQGTRTKKLRGTTKSRCTLTQISSSRYAPLRTELKPCRYCTLQRDRHHHHHHHFHHDYRERFISALDGPWTPQGKKALSLLLIGATSCAKLMCLLVAVCSSCHCLFFRHSSVCRVSVHL